jgi:hypothetical protein
VENGRIAGRRNRYHLLHSALARHRSDQAVAVGQRANAEALTPRPPLPQTASSRRARGSRSAAGWGVRAHGPHPPAPSPVQIRPKTVGTGEGESRCSRVRGATGVRLPLLGRYATSHKTAIALSDFDPPGADQSALNASSLLEIPPQPGAASERGRRTGNAFPVSTRSDPVLGSICRPLAMRGDSWKCVAPIVGPCA